MEEFHILSKFFISKKMTSYKKEYKSHKIKELKIIFEKEKHTFKNVKSILIPA